MKVAVEGCCHGELDKIYHTIEIAKTQAGIEAPDVLICCGDFQSFRNHSDLQTFAAPPKYRQLGSFWKYYNGEKIAPILTVFVGGNHEASGYLWELYHGGWVAPNIYFLGFAGSVILKKTLSDGTIDSVRISGVSGIYKKHDYYAGHYERLPYDNGTIRSIYHVREYDVFRISQLPISSSSDIFVSHDWPLGIEQHGNTAQLLRAKPFFRNEVATNTLGSPPLLHLLKTIKPHYWFSAHLHVKFAALYHHDPHPEDRQSTTTAPAALDQDKLQTNRSHDGNSEKTFPASLTSSLINPDMILIDDSDEDEVALNKATLQQLSPQAHTLVKEQSDHLRAAHSNECTTAPLNPDELEISLDTDEDDENPSNASLEPSSLNPSMIHIDHDEIVLKRTPTDNPSLKTHSSMNIPSQLGATQDNAPRIIDRSLSICKASIQKKSATATKSASTNSQNPQNSSATMARMTRFLALNKCLPRKDFLQILNIHHSNVSAQVSIEAPPSVQEQNDMKLTADQVLVKSVVDANQDGKIIGSATSLFFDPDWLAITRAFHSYIPLQKHGNPKLPTDSLEISNLFHQELAWVNENIPAESLEISNVQQFVKTAPGIGDPGGEDTGQPCWYTNPQTLAFARLLGIENKINEPAFN